MMNMNALKLIAPACALLGITGCLLNAEWSGKKIEVAYEGDDWTSLFLEYKTVPIHVTGSDEPGVHGTVEVGGLVNPGDDSLEDDPSVEASFANDGGVLRLKVSTTSKNERLTLGAIDLNASRTHGLDLHSTDGDITTKGMTGPVRIGTHSGKILVEQGTPATGLPELVTIDTDIGDIRIDTTGPVDLSTHINEITGSIGGGGKLALGDSQVSLRILSDTFDSLTVGPSESFGGSTKTIDFEVPAGSGFNANINVVSGSVCIRVGSTQHDGTTFQGAINGGGNGAAFNIDLESAAISIHEPNQSCPES